MDKTYHDKKREKSAKRIQKVELENIIQYTTKKKVTATTTIGLSIKCNSPIENSTSYQLSTGEVKYYSSYLSNVIM